MRILISGDRHWYCPDLADQIVARLVKRYGPEIVIVHGAADDVDTSFAEAADEAGIEQEPHPARWAELGKKAGPTRNAEMVQAGADLCIACHRSLASSKGTKDCIRQALAAEIPVYLIADDLAIPRRILAGDSRLV
jgi:YspA, cpYpsA-related SLOG family